MASQPHHRFTREEYERMGEVNILHDDDRVELICGEILTMRPIGAFHADGVAILDRRLNRLLPDDLLVFNQSPIRLPHNSVPQPDLAVVRYARYKKSLPTAADTLLVIEVADSSRDYDPTTKMPLYAAAGIAEACLVDLGAERVERYTRPSAAGYGMIILARRGETVQSTVVPVLSVSVDDILGAPE